LGPVDPIDFSLSLLYRLNKLLKRGAVDKRRRALKNHAKKLIFN